jgi:hypothetical protein
MAQSLAPSPQCGRLAIKHAPGASLRPISNINHSFNRPFQITLVENAPQGLIFLLDLFVLSDRARVKILVSACNPQVRIQHH